MNNVAQILKSLHEDFALLQSGEWVPDDESCDASMELIERAAELLGVNLKEENEDD